MLELQLIEQLFIDGRDIEVWDIISDEERLGSLQVAQLNSDILVIEDIFIRSDSRGKVGVSGVRQLIRLIKKEYPGVTEVVGRRISGVRARSAPIEPRTGERELPIGTAQLVRRRI